MTLAGEYCRSGTCCDWSHLQELEVRASHAAGSPGWPIPLASVVASRNVSRSAGAALPFFATAGLRNQAFRFWHSWTPATVTWPPLCWPAWQVPWLCAVIERATYTRLKQKKPQMVAAAWEE